MMSTTVKDQVLALGADEAKAERVAEAAIRRSNAQRQKQPFLYIDVVFELEDLYRSNGASDDAIEKAKWVVWSAAREISAELGFPIEECLFFCFHEATDVYRESLVAEASADVDAEANANGDVDTDVVADGNGNPDAA